MSQSEKLHSFEQKAKPMQTTEYRAQAPLVPNDTKYISFEWMVHGHDSKRVCRFKEPDELCTS